MLLAFKYRLYPSKEQEILITKTIGSARFVYNNLLEEYKAQLEVYNKTDKSGDKPKFKLVTYLKKEHDFLSEVDSLALANARTNLENALRNFFSSLKGKRKGKKTRFPKKHKKTTCKWSYTTNNLSNSIRFEGSTIKLPKLGFVEVELHREFQGIPRSVTVSQERNGTFYVSVLSEVESKCKRKNIDNLNNLKVVGLDMSFSNFVVSSDDTKTTYIRQTRQNEKKRIRLNRTMSRRVNGSKNRNKARVHLANLDRYITNSRKDFCHKQSNFYAKNYDVIVLENLNMQSMSKTLRLGKSAMDLGFGMFKQFLAYKCQREDTLLLYADKWFASSKLCSSCGYKNSELKLSDREWVCPECGMAHDRDVNAACNLRDYFYKILNTAGTAGINACGEDASTLRETLAQVLSLSQEAPSFRVG